MQHLTSAVYSSKLGREIFFQFSGFFRISVSLFEYFMVSAIQPVSRDNIQPMALCSLTLLGHSIYFSEIIAALMRMPT